MNDILQKILNIRSDKKINLDPTNYNRYTVTVTEADRTKTAYCFGVPVYNGKTNNLIDLKFHHRGLSSSFNGSGASVSFKDSFLLQNGSGSCSISFPGKLYKKTEPSLFFEASDSFTEVTPTLNGLLFRMPTSGAELKLILDERVPLHEVKCNEKYFAFMKEQFKPFLTVSCVGSLTTAGVVTAPCKIGARKVSDREYVLTVKPESKTAKYVTVEANLHEQKLFQDTTVESLHPKANNAFGGVAFIGSTRQFGEQQLYARLDFSILPHLHDKRIRKAILRLPNLNHSAKPLLASRTVNRFCSFGSNWENKIALAEFLGEAEISKHFYSFDIKDIVTQATVRSADFVIRQKSEDGKVAVLSTGDSYCNPLILGINYY